MKREVVVTEEKSSSLRLLIELGLSLGLLAFVFLPFYIRLGSPLRGADLLVFGTPTRLAFRQLIETNASLWPLATLIPFNAVAQFTLVTVILFIFANLVLRFIAFLTQHVLRGLTILMSFIMLGIGGFALYLSFTYFEIYWNEPTTYLGLIVFLGISLIQLVTALIIPEIDPYQNIAPSGRVEINVEGYNILDDADDEVNEPRSSIPEVASSPWVAQASAVRYVEAKPKIEETLPVEEPTPAVEPVQTEASIQVEEPTPAPVNQRVEIVESFEMDKAREKEDQPIEIAIPEVEESPVEVPPVPKTALEEALSFDFTKVKPRTIVHREPANKRREVKITEVMSHEELKRIKNQGKYEIYPEAGLFKYRLKASNGEILLVSNGYLSREGAAVGIETLKKNIPLNMFEIVTDKNGYSQYRLFTANRSRVVAYGEFYDSDSQAESAIASTFRFGLSDRIVQLDSIVEDEVREEVAPLGAVDELSGGKVELLRDNGRWVGQLKANNGEVLFVTDSYSTKNTLLVGLQSIKAGVAKSNFRILWDKQFRYQFKLYTDNNQQLLVGQTYSTKESALNAMESVRRFMPQARIVEIPIPKASIYPTDFE